VSRRDGTIATAQNAATTAQNTANTKRRIIPQDSPPGGAGYDVGDMWIETDDSNELHTWNGSGWVSRRDGTIATAQDTATEANNKSSNYNESGNIQGNIEISSGNIRAGQTAYNTGIGFFLGISSSVPKFSIGNPAGNHLSWDGSNLNIVGDLNISSADVTTALTYTPIASGSAAADVNNNTTTISGGKITTGTLEANSLVANTTFTQSLILGEFGRIHTPDKTFALDTTPGIYLGWDAHSNDAYKFAIGDADNSLIWNGLSLSVRGAITAESLTLKSTTNFTGIENMSDGVTLSASGGKLIINGEGVGVPQIASASLGTARGVSDGDISATQTVLPFSTYSSADPFHYIGSWGDTPNLALQTVASYDFVTADGGTLPHEITLEFSPSGTFPSDSEVALVYHIQQAINGQSYLINQTIDHPNITRTITGYSVATGTLAGRQRRIPNFRNLFGNTQTYIRVYGYQRNVGGTPEYDAVHVSITALTKGTT
jgi:hypothetical protein